MRRSSGIRSILIASLSTLIARANKMRSVSARLISVRCKQLMQLAPQVIEGIFKAYFEQGRNLGSTDVLASVAKDAGLDEEQVRVLIFS